MYKLAVVGNPIAHSLSPPIHAAFAKQCKLDVQYDKILAPLERFNNTVREFFSQGGHGLNVTVPFKQQAFALCKGALTDRALAAGAVNTLYMEHGTLAGDNTDGQGLVYALTSLGWKLQDANIALIGAGGAARGVVLPLIKAGAKHISIANRTLAKADVLVSQLAEFTSSSSLSSSTIQAVVGEFDIIINATSASLSEAALPFSNQLKAQYAYDMVYAKSGKPTPFMTHFTDQGAQVADGLSMLIGQAAISFEIWTGYKPKPSEIDFSFLQRN